MNERVKQLRKILNLSGEKFGENIGVKRSAISDIETGRNNLSDQMIKLICYAYNVNENWLRTGEGDIFIKTDASYLQELQDKHHLSDLSIEIIKSYIELPQEERLAIENFISSIRSKTDNNIVE